MRSRSTAIAALLAAAVLMGLPCAEAQLLSYEGFDYPNDGSALLGGKNGGTGWGGPWTLSGAAATNNCCQSVSQDDVSLDSLAFPFTPIGDRVLAQGFGSGGNNAWADRRFAMPFDLSVEGNVMYLSFLFRKDSGTTTASDNMEVDLLPDVGVANPVVRFGSTSGEQFFISDGGSATGNMEFLTLGTPYFVVMKLEAHAGTTPNVYYASVYAPGDTVPLTEPAVWEGSRNHVSNSTLNAIRLWIGTVTQGQYDEIRIGSTWASVTVPEPGTMSVAALAIFGLMFSAPRKRT